MRFSETIGYKPKDKTFISIKEYNGSDDRRQYYYEPLYYQYRTKKVRSYSDCEECGHREFTGWVEEEYPIGEPYRYHLIKQSIPWKVYNHMIKNVVDSVNRSNVLANRILGVEDEQ